MDAVGDDACVLGAFGAKESMMDERAVAVLQAQTAGAALIGHMPFLAPAGDEIGLPRGIVGTASAPAEFVQSIVVDAEVVRDLVDHCDGHFVDDLLLAVTEVQQRLAVDGDGVR